MNIKSIIKSANGRFMVISFIKRDGSTRTMLCRTGVRKFVKGNTPINNLLKEDIQIVYDMQKKAYRSFNLSRVISIKFNGKIQYHHDYAC